MASITDLPVLVALLVGIALGTFAMVVHGAFKGRRRSELSAPASSPPAPSEAAIVAPAPSSPPAGAPASAQAPPDDIFALATSLESLCRKSAHPRDMLENERFQRGVELFLESERSPEALLDYMGSGRIAIACLALEALARRMDPADVAPLTQRIVADYTQIDMRPAWFALRALAARAEEPVVGRALARAGKGWAGSMRIGFLREFVSQRIARGEMARFDDHLETITPDRIGVVTNVIERLKDLLPEEMREEFRAWQAADNDPFPAQAPPGGDATPDRSNADIATLEMIGRIWRPDAPEARRVHISDRLEAVIAQLQLALRADPPRSVAVIGEPGVGKTSLVRVLAQQFQQDGWTVFEAGAGELVAGQIYIGQVDERLQTLLRALRKGKVLWIVPSFQELLWAGAYKENPTGVLDKILPALERGDITLVAEMTPAAHERLLRSKPQLRGALFAAPVPLPDGTETLDLARRWAMAHASDNTSTLLSERTLREALQLANQYITGRSAPGNVLDLLTLTWRRLVTAGNTTPREITHDDLLLTLSQLTGLPMNMLDERGTLDLHALRTSFNQRVIGQPEAVDCLVERIAMMKAGVTDPTRAAGVFLFVGPTGTGKTEIAKTLARHLFGSADRMVRVDMSELQTPDSISRILGDPGDTHETTALVDAIRRQPFSVVLLDEFEKAHSNVWDLFLQVFDDGRLTDGRGNVADFRHAVIILTSNLGATLPYGAVIGFAPGQADFAATSVERAVGDTFRREFVNRIDRVVVFRPLGRAEMREILHKELNDVFQRRGLRNRSWAVEWEASAIDFLLEKGFTPDLGARPLKRAIERYLLAPLAGTIVTHKVPAGEQFLFVRSDGDQLDVVFIDPDAPDADADVESRGWESAAKPDVRRLVLDARGTREEVDFLDDRYADLAEQVQSPEWQTRKAESLAAMRARGFWESPDRFAVLGTAEYMDRIEAGLDTASSLLRRLTHSSPRARVHYPRDVVQRLAQQLYLLEAACSALATGAPRDAYVLVRASRDSGTDQANADAFAERIGCAYREWARKRRMRFELLDETRGNGMTPYSLLAAISGFGAFSILMLESGLHVLETPQDAKSFNRVKARVVVAPQDETPAANPRDARTRAMRAIEARSDETAQVIVRRYREDPSPLVRDAIRQWRTGRVDLVFGGDFDVLA